MKENAGCSGGLVLVFGLILIGLSLGAMGRHTYSSLDDKWWGAPLSIMGGFIAFFGWSMMNDKDNSK